MYATRLFVCVAALTVLAWGAVISGPGHLALVLDGTTSVAIPSDASSLAGKSFSFEAWINVPSIGTQMPIASRINSSSAAPTNEQNDFSLQINAQGNVILLFGGSADNMGFLIHSTNAIQSNTWYHVAFTIEYLNTDNDTPYRATLYVDSYPSGKLVRDMQIGYWYGPGHTRISLTNEVITVGKYINNVNPSGIFFSGSIDEVRVWQGVRTGSDIKSYSLISIENQADSLWALTPTQSQGGTSSQLLVCSYNMNEGASRSRATSSLSDQSKNQFTATITGNAVFGANPNQFIQYVRVSGEVPAVIPLFGSDSTTASSAGVQFVVYWIDSELQGEVFSFSSLNTGRPNKTHPYNPPERKQDVGLGSMLINNSNVDITEKSAIVYVTLPNFTGTNARLRYYSVLAGVQSPVTEVRLVVGCAGNQSLIDKCGVCLGDNSTCRYCAHIDRCGVCNGTNACVGCDNVTNSGMEIDQCGVCGGLNLCKGCDHMGGGVKDACGVCNGDNSTCGLPTVDHCGILNGDNSSCTCVRYHGYHVQELDYLLLKWGIQNSLSNIDRVLALLDESLTLLQNYEGDVDLASVVAYLNDFSSGSVVPYDTQISWFVNELNKALGDQE